MSLYTTWGVLGRVQCVFTCLHVSLCVWTAVSACQHSFSEPPTYFQRDMTETTSHEIQLPRFLLASWGALSWHKHFVKKKLGVYSCCFLLRAKQDLVGKQLLNSGRYFFFRLHCSHSFTPLFLSLSFRGSFPLALTKRLLCAVVYSIVEGFTPVWPSLRCWSRLTTLRTEERWSWRGIGITFGAKEWWWSSWQASTL